MEDLAECFRLRFVEVARQRLRVALAGVASGDAGAAAGIAAELHTLAGEAGALGYPGIMELARSAEKRLGQAADPGAFSECEDLLREISQAVEALVPGPAAL
jgi:HPt (histidine-containing phosphotransfer) domain-containing protein